MRTAFNLLLFLIIAFALSTLFFKKGEGFTASGVKGLKYYTVDSNILCAAACLCCAVGGDQHWIAVLRFAGTVAVLVTMLIVIFLLVPAFGLKAMYTGRDFILHLVAPLMAVVTFCFFEKNIRPGEAAWGAVSVLAYGAAYLLNIRKNGMEDNDWYGFAQYGLKQKLMPVKAFWWVEVVLFTLFAYLLSLGLFAMHP